MILSEQDFTTIILGSLSKSYDQFLLAITTTASMLKQELNPDDLMQTIIDEYNQKSTRPGAPKEKNMDTVFYARTNHQTKAGKKMNNCKAMLPNENIPSFCCHS